MKLFLHVHTRDNNYKQLLDIPSRDAFEESKHHRGQPKNAGQFASGSGSKGTKRGPASSSERARPLPHSVTRSKTVPATTAPAVKLPVKYVTKAPTKSVFEYGGREENATGYVIEDKDGTRVHVVISDESHGWKVYYTSGTDPKINKSPDAQGRGQAALNKELAESLPLIITQPKGKSESGSQQDKIAAYLSRTRVNEAVHQYETSFKKEADASKAFENIGNAVFDYMGIKDSVSLQIKEPYEFEVAGHKYTTGGWFDPNTNTVTMCNTLNVDERIAGLVSHEAMHAKYNTVKRALAKEVETMLEDTRGDLITGVMDPQGNVREEFKNDYPIHAAMSKLLGNTAQLRRDDVITDYSRSYWEAVKMGSGSIENAVNETLAEMAKLDREGSLPRLIWYKESTSYKPLYKAIHDIYPAASQLVD
jgi:hypothetical protein